MPTQPIDTPDIMNALIDASLRSRRAKLLRSARNQRIRTRVGFGCSGCIALLALAAIFLAHDPKAAVILSLMAIVTFSFAYFVGRSSQKKLADSLRHIGSVEEIVGNLR
jgi:VIT1/CCC1 family predicted Fe2+/Mn2+ transporter